MQHRSKFLFCAGGIFVCYFYFGVLQEKVTRGEYLVTVVENGVEKVVEEKYTYALVLVFMQCLVNYVFAIGMLYFWPHGEDKTPRIYSASSALTYLLAMVCSNMALQWVSYPTQVVGKSGKPIPVMILGVLVGRKSYPLRKYLFVLMIVIGVVLFMYKEKASAQGDASIVGLGELLIILSLIMDGLTGAIQERWKVEAQPTAQQMMRGMNGWSCLFVSVALVLSNEIFEFIEFIVRHPSVLTNISLLSLAGALGQLFIFLTVTEFGPLPCSVITTTRKFFTVLGSVILFGNKLFPRQWLGALVVFTGLFLDAYYGKLAPPKKK